MADAAEDTTQAPPQNALPKRWGDEEDDTVEEPSASSSNSEEKAASELKVEALTINDDESKINKFLDEPQDSNITAVRSLSWL
jgi:ATP-dependent RNA helicase DDX19/DBP5